VSSNVREMREEIRQFRGELEQLDNRLENTRNLFTSTMILMRKMNLPPEINMAINTLARARLSIDQFIRGLELAEAAVYSGGPVGWALALVTLGIAVISVTDLAMDLER